MRGLEASLQIVLMNRVLEKNLGTRDVARGYDRTNRFVQRGAGVKGGIKRESDP